MHVGYLNSQKRIGGARLARCQVEAHDFKVVIVTDLGYILEQALSLLGNDLYVRVILSVFVRRIPVDLDEPAPVFFPYIADIGAVCPVDCDSLAL